jgi:PAS domain S-box-containing protein
MTPREQLASATMIATHEIVMNLEKAKSALESLVNGMQDFTCLVTCEGRIVWGNKKAAACFGCDQDVVQQENMQRLFSEKDFKEFLDLLNPFRNSGLKGEPIEFQLPISLGGKQRDILWSARPFQAVSIRRGTILLLVGRDITDVLSERAERAKLEGELETAQLMQAAFFPSSHICTPSIEICSYYRPADQCSGDWWGHFNLGDGLDLVCIADVTGHGAASALVTAMTQATCMTFATKAREVSRAESARFPSQLLNQINKVVYDTFRGKFFMTFFAMLFDTEEGVMRACNAGHNFPMFIRGPYRQQALSGTVLPENVKPFRGPEALALQGNPIGFDPNSEYPEREIPLQNLDRFLMFTDGIIECKNEAGQMFGSPNLRKAMTRFFDRNALMFRDSIIETAITHYGQQPLADDLTMVVIDVFLSGKKNLANPGSGI